MAADNTIGAPTEGLGQTVTFAFNPPGRPPGLQLPDPGLIRAGVVGGNPVAPGSTQAANVDIPRVDKTMQQIASMGDAYVNKKIKEARTANYIAGMQRAMQGEAVADIAKEQPWYSKLFGDSDVVEGARAYASHTIVQQQVAAMEGKMPELRQMAPQEAQQYFINAVNGSMTGDQATDLHIMTGLTRAMPAFMKHQAKEHYGFQQEQATAAESAAFASGAMRLQSAAKSLASGYTTPEEFDGLTSEFVRSLVPAAGRDIENYKQSITNNMIGWAESGQFHALNAVKKHGLFDVLEPDQRNRLGRAIETGEGRLRTHYSFEWNNDLALIDEQAAMPNSGTDTNDLAKRIDGLNQRFKDETGSDRGLIEPGQRAGLLSRNAVTIRRSIIEEAEKAARDAAAQSKVDAKAAEHASKTATTLQRWADGTLGTLVAGKFVSNEDVNEIIVPAYTKLPPEQRAAVLVREREGYVIPAIRDIRMGQIENALAGEAPTPEAQAAFEEYARLREKNKFVADNYYGKYATRLDGLYNDLQNGGDFAGALKRNFFGAERKAEFSEKDMKTAVSEVNNQTGGLFSFLPAWAGGQQMDAGQLRRAANAVGEQAKKYAATGNGDLKQGVSRALQERLSSGKSEILGGYFFDNNKGQQKLFDFLTTKPGRMGERPLPTSAVNDHVKAAIDSALYGPPGGKAGILPGSADDVEVIRLDDAGGVPMLAVMATKDGKVYRTAISAYDIVDDAVARVEYKNRVAETPATIVQDNLTRQREVKRKTEELLRKR